MVHLSQNNGTYDRLHNLGSILANSSVLDKDLPLYETLYANWILWIASRPGK